MKNATIDPVLPRAVAQWEPFLDQGMDFMCSGDGEAAISCFSEAITISARFHPLIHFLEAGLNTELGLLLLHKNQFEVAASSFERAIFMDHNNEAAKEGLLATRNHNSELSPSPYPMARLTAELPPASSADTYNIRALRKQARSAENTKEAIQLYKRAIEICEATHQAYHKAAALPWLLRARAFQHQGERALAKNDARRGLDLDAKHPDLLSLSAISL